MMLSESSGEPLQTSSISGEREAREENRDTAALRPPVHSLFPKTQLHSCRTDSSQPLVPLEPARDNSPEQSSRPGDSDEHEQFVLVYRNNQQISP